MSLGEKQPPRQRRIVVMRSDKEPPFRRLPVRKYLRKRARHNRTVG